MATAFEMNFDGLVGPTHNYAGLSFGNIASTNHARSVSHPRAGALQGLAKMKYLHDLGLKQGILPPHRRPNLSALRKLGFTGSDSGIIKRASRENPGILAAVYSASAMWTANAATISAGQPTVHITPANLITQFHRSIETFATAATLRQIFRGDAFLHHDPLPAATAYADEGAANHMRLSPAYGRSGIEIFVYGRSGDEPVGKFPARQTLAASRAIARLHNLKESQTVFLRQNPAAIEAGAFHNDVVAVSNQNVLLMHAGAFADCDSALDEIKSKYKQLFGEDPVIIAADASEITLADAVQTYIFNSQLVTLPDNSMALIAPVECQNHPRVQSFLKRVLANSPIRAVHYLDVRQSMNNGGGPACLRLRVPLTENQFSKVHPGVIFTTDLHAALTAWITRRYRETLAPADLADPALITETGRALDELSKILGISI